MVYSDLSYAYRRLRDTLGEERVSKDHMEQVLYTHDFASLPKQAAIQFRLNPDLMVLPKSTQEVVRVLRLGKELELPVVPRGGGTSLHAGSVPNLGGILLSTSLMKRVVEVDVDRRFLTIQGGATWDEALEAAEAAGMSFPLEPLLRRAATVGGHLSNGGVGIGSYKYGAFSRWVRSLEVVLPDGDVLETGERAFDLGSRNYNLTNLFLGAEGTLGVITKATLRLRAKPEGFAVAAYGFPDMATLGEGLRALTQSPVTPYHIGFFDESHLIMQRAFQGYRAWARGPRAELEQTPRVPALPAAALVAFEGSKDQVQAEAKATAQILTEAGGTRQEDFVAELLWAQRDQPYQSRRISGGLVAVEALVPLSRLEEAVAGATKLARKMKTEAAFHGFLTDRSSALLVPYLVTDERTLRGQLSLAFVERFHEFVLGLQGHPVGLGFLATYNLAPMFGPLVGMMQGIKNSLDPDNVVNRGKLVETLAKPPPLYPFSEFIVPPGLMRFGLRFLSAFRRLMPSQRIITRLKKRGV
ncbi:MAG: FAD-binding oxidoreductase [Candidatus Thermoplasmatota archaeon]|nr:FAD-binding oxidoreductase [Candidatus Thermoplasmatota archaeon]